MIIFQVNENDELPTNVCRKCVDNVINWHKFKNVCERTQNKLQSLINKDGSQLEEVGLTFWMFKLGIVTHILCISIVYLCKYAFSGSNQE